MEILGIAVVVSAFFLGWTIGAALAILLRRRAIDRSRENYRIK